MDQLLSSLAAAVFLALAAFMARSVFAVILLSLASGAAWLQQTPGISYEWQVRATWLSLALYALALTITVAAALDQ